MRFMQNNLFACMKSYVASKTAALSPGLRKHKHLLGTIKIEYTTHSLESICFAVSAS